MHDSQTDILVFPLQKQVPLNTYNIKTKSDNETTYFISISDPKIETNNPILSSFSAIAAQSLANRKNVSTRPLAGTMKITLSRLIFSKSIACRSWIAGVSNFSWTRLLLKLYHYIAIPKPNGSVVNQNCNETCV